MPDNDILSPGARPAPGPVGGPSKGAGTQLVTYPIKGCAGVDLPQVTMTIAGPAHDRSFMVISPDGVFRSQRHDPRLATICPSLSSDGKRLSLSAPGLEPLCESIVHDGPRRAVTLFGTSFAGIDQGERIAEWLSQVLGGSSRLVRVPPDHRRVSDGQTPGTAGYADSCAVHLIAQSSLDRLNQQIARSGGQPVAMSRFRPNIVVDGWAEPHQEDQARSLRIGGTELAYAKLAIRCVVTTVDQDSGERRGPGVLQALAQYRRTTGGLAFGTKFAVSRPGPLRVGDQVSVTRWDVSEF